MIVRFAKESELDRVNELRKQVNDIHVESAALQFFIILTSQKIHL